jgi:pyruvate/2-oxoglutarate/acetoin dehydrogenase E1 component
MGAMKRPKTKAKTMDTEPLAIQVSIRAQYGAQTIVPECAKAKLFAQIAGTKTLTPQTIRDIKSLGYAVQVVTFSPSTL